MNKISVIGIGPGAYEKLTLEAQKALEAAEVIVGYTLYIDLIRFFFPDKTYIGTGMRTEESRCKTAFEYASRGHKVALVCSGDAGVYGLAGLMLGMEKHYPGCEVKIIPGITAALAGAAILGAPLIHDFALISLSDLLTPWEKIEKRLRLAAEADFVICIYNPSSKKRREHLRKACDILLRYREEETTCAAVRNITREGEAYHIMSLAKLKEFEADMFSTIYIGNSMTKREGKRMITPRGYKSEE
ncbi:MAG: precorrin-3B C(17)-methyltransferase [Johnsonella sp.]|nr:precorrin-3B C(17)-methyltransferase [Johnsonella sp.]